MRSSFWILICLLFSTQASAASIQQRIESARSQIRNSLRPSNQFSARANRRRPARESFPRILRLLHEARENGALSESEIQSIVAELRHLLPRVPDAQLDEPGHPLRVTRERLLDSLNAFEHGTTASHEPELREGSFVLVKRFDPKTGLVEENAFLRTDREASPESRFGDIREEYPRGALQDADLQGKKVLDIGAGNGGLVRYLIEEKKADTIGVDIALNGAQAASPFFRKADATKLPFDDGTFDYVYSTWSVFSHNYSSFMNTEALLKCLREAARVLKSGGKIRLGGDVDSDRILPLLSAAGLRSLPPPAEPIVGVYLELEKLN